MSYDNVKIPRQLLDNALNVLEHIYSSDAFRTLAPDFMAYFESVLWDLRKKQHSAALRSAYARIILVRTETERHSARIVYLRLRNEPPNVF